MNDHAPSPYFMGNERRGNEVEALSKALRDHMTEETNRYQEFADMQDQLANKIEVYHNDSEERHDETQRQLGHMTQSLEAFMSETHELFVSFKKAFPKDSDGMPDYTGHRNDHEVRMERSIEDKRLMEYVDRQMKGDEKWTEDKRFLLRTLAATLAGGFLLWTATALWRAFLIGPQ